MARENRDDGPLGPPVFRCPQEIKSRNDECVHDVQGSPVWGKAGRTSLSFAPLGCRKPRDERYQVSGNLLAEKVQWEATMEQPGPSASPFSAKTPSFQDAVRTLNTLQTNAGYLEQVKRQRGDPQTQLEAMKLYLARSGLQVEDLDQLNIIHVTGTKGKGSTCAFTERILRSYGLKTGFFSSPHLVQVRERIRINGQPISPELFTKHFWHLYHRLEETKDSNSCVSMPAYFRFLTLMAFHIFLQEKVDLAVVEVGIGGAYDCTNIIRKPVVCGISSLGLDHTSLLGDTVEEIAWQKGGIFKRGVPAFTVLQPDGPLAVLQDRAQKISCPLYLCPPLEALEEGGPPLALGLEGEHQRSNAALALQLARCWLQQKNHQGLGELKVSRPSVLWQMPLAPVFQPTSHMRHGLRDTEWLGRTQVLRRGPLTWYLDGAHTASSVQACVRWFRQALLRGRVPRRGPEVRVLLFNSTGDRDPVALLKLLQPCQFDYAVFCPNLTEVSSAGNADQQNFMVTLDQVLLRCLAHQQHWSHLNEEHASPNLWSPTSLEPGEPTSLLLASHQPHTHSTSSLVFSCISHALQWISQGRDPVFQPPSPPQGLLAHPVAGSGASLLRDAVAIHVLVTGSLHLVGGVLKLLEPALSQ
ncbi:folylpolyglutamate synthase, mitochondrial isoform X8 [Canis lupus familiaris]|uniref:folylpolyglutamate synthase, mitochondrial isoform X8 n=1 Tax=Canis lupus familiaris TaxID=9615 RepID=UPI000BAA02A2|nr:folylpolyglutamate synthase, mitochondrial isoform X8 [Canis lupus familiaris]XP_038405192.1 folylpolyglutamate synthase, mitochondrial isoform X6 [Canis lupus familiaris]|eukprot:XP_005625388.2 folylpolyglutamate synthase, mitochondrial isoform X1 [Canis lupus familiaris]